MFHSFQWLQIRPQLRVGVHESISQGSVEGKFVFKLLGKFPHEPSLIFDGANGVGSVAMKGLLKQLNDLEENSLKVEIFNANVDNGEMLNLNCGADFVKVGQQSPENLPNTCMKRCVSVDGDADRVVFYYNELVGNHF